jgi:hypothetical protein
MNFISHPVALSLLGPNILLSTMFSDTFNQFVSIRTRGKIPNPYKTTEKCLNVYISSHKMGRLAILI